MQENIQLRKLKRPRKKDTIKKHYKFHMDKKTIYPGKQERKIKVLKSPIAMTGIQKVLIVG